MKRAELEALGLSKEHIDSIMTMNGADINNAKKDYDDLSKSLKEKETSIGELNAKIEGFNGTESQLADLQKEIESYKTAETTRLAEIERQKTEAVIKQTIASAVGEKKFLNQYTQLAIENEVMAELLKAENVGKSATDVLTEITKDRTDVWANPQHDTTIIPPTGNQGKSTLTVDQIRKMSADEINANWETVQRTLSNPQ